GRRRHTRWPRDWSSDVCSSDLPMVSRIHFLECAGNSQLLYQPTPPNLSAGQTHGLVSCSEWTGVPLRLLLEEAGVERGAPWILRSEERRVGKWWRRRCLAGDCK